MTKRFEFHSNFRGADEIRDLSILIDFQILKQGVFTSVSYYNSIVSPSKRVIHEISLETTLHVGLGLCVCVCVCIYIYIMLLAAKGWQTFSQIWILVQLNQRLVNIKKDILQAVKEQKKNENCVFIPSILERNKPIYLIMSI